MGKFLSDILGILQLLFQIIFRITVGHSVQVVEITKFD